MHRLPATAPHAKYQERVNTLTERVRRFHDRNVPFRIYHGNTNSTRTLVFDRQTTLDTSGLTHVLGIDPSKKTAIVESNVPMDVLVRETLRYDLMPPVVPEFPGITVGGAIQGGAGESSSFKWGGVNSCANWCDIILADGTLTRASRMNHADLFWGMAGSYGTLGVITATEIQLIPAKKYVAVTYIPVTSFAEAADAVSKATADGYDFVDGILFSRDSGVIVAGKLADTATGTVCRYRRPHDPWFYLHAEKRAAAGAVTTEYIPLMDYLFRYDRGAFWMGKYAFDMFGVAFNRRNRLLLNGLLNTRRMYQALQGSGAAQQFIIQDVAVPAHNTHDFLQYVDRQFGIYPLWLCPLQTDVHSPLHANYLGTKDILNVGVWGPFEGSHADFIGANKDLERTVHDLGGRKWLYAHTYYDERDFWNIYDKDWYDKLRLKYKATTLPTVYDKVHVAEERQPINKKRGVWRAIASRRAVSVK